MSVYVRKVTGEEVSRNWQRSNFQKTRLAGDIVRLADREAVGEQDRLAKFSLDKSGGGKSGGERYIDHPPTLPARFSIYSWSLSYI
jgi:hypothetical protein